MILDGGAHARVLALQFGIAPAHEALQFGEFAHHLGLQVGLGQNGGAGAQIRVSTGHLGQFTRQRGDALHACALRSELLVEHHAEMVEPGHALVQRPGKIKAELFGAVPQPVDIGQRPLVRLPEMQRVREARAHHPLIAGHDGLAAIGRDLVGHQKEAVREIAVAIAQHEALLVGADRGADHLARNGEEGRVEGAHQHGGPFHKPGHLIEQALILDQLQPLGEGEVAGLVGDQRLAPLGIEHDMGGFEPGDIIIQPAHADGLPVRQEAMAEGDIAGADAVHLEGDDLRLPGFRPEAAQDGMQRAHPAQAGPRSRGRAPAHGFRPGKGAHHLRHDLGDGLAGGPARPLDQRDIAVALLGVALDRGLIDGGEAGGFQEALDGGVRRADARPLALLAHVRALHGQAGDVQGQAPWRGEGARALIMEAALHQRVGDQLLQVFRGLALHARGNFLGEQFEQKIGHGERIL